ncbi:MAG TPA: ABC transporter ATP-binding protein [Vicinamibacterales bacterium]|nr:ABC transporter ATP-binding protein [Vicinamibacterales bacterium]
MTATSETVVGLAGIEKSFGSTRAVAGVSCEVRRGEMFGVIGPDGAGKTTLLRLICGLLRPDKGEVRLFGDDPFRARTKAAEAIGYLSQRFSLYGDLSIDENIEFFARIHGVPHFADRRTRLLELTGLLPFRHRLADRLSGGMKQKLALACTLVHEPRLLVLDEPTTGVDPVSRREFWKLLADFLASGLTIVLATPYLDEAERCHRVALVIDGLVIALDEPAALQAASPGVMLEVVVTPARRALEVARTAAMVDDVQLFGDRLHVRSSDAGSADVLTRQLEAAGLTVASVREVPPSLEDVFIQRMAQVARTATAHSTAARGVEAR